MPTRLGQADAMTISPDTEGASDAEETRRELVALRRRNEQLENFFAQMADAIFVTEMDGRIIDANPTACALLEYSRSELLAMHLWDFDSGTTQGQILDFVTRLQYGMRTTVQRTYRCKSGEELSIDLCLTRFNSGERDLVIVSCRDVTGRKRLEEQLRRSEHNLAQGQRLSKTGSWILDPNTGTAEWSAGICRIFGFPDPPPLPHYNEFLARVHPRDRDEVDRLLRECWETGEPKLFQFVFVLPDGTDKHLETLLQPVRDEKGHLVRLMSTVMDVTERHLYEERLRASEALALGQMRALTRTLDAIAQEPSPDKLLEHVLSTIIEQLQIDGISEWHLDEIGDPWTPEFLARSSDQENESGVDRNGLNFRMPLQDCPLLPQILATRKAIFCEDLLQYPDFPFKEHMLAQGVGAVIAVPLLIAGEVVGVISLRYRHSRRFRPEEIELAQALAHQATLAIQLTRQTRQSRQVAVEAERNRLARDIHDTLAQGFTGVIVHLDAAEDAISKGLPQAADEHITRAATMAHHGLAEARRSVHALRPQILEDSELCLALDSLIKHISVGTRLKADFVLQGQPRPLPSDWNEHLLRITQESLTNSLRHANATCFLAQLAFDSREIRFDLQDNGCGFDPSQKSSGFGLRGIHERVAGMDGVLKIETAPGQGTTISLRLPFTGQDPYRVEKHELTI